jgi:hypothetical protein
MVVWGALQKIYQPTVILKVPGQLYQPLEFSE